MTILIYIAVLLSGGFISARGFLKPGVEKLADRLLNGTLFVLIFMMGIKIGMDENVVNGFRTIGIQALVLAVSSVAFSIAGVRMVAKYVLRWEEDLQ